MNKILIISDTHTNLDFQKIIMTEQADYVLHAGDSQLELTNPALQKVDYVVRGNCDHEKFQEQVTFTLPEIGAIYLTHGHLEDVKFKLDKLIDACLSKNIALCIYGHTHLIHLEYLADNDLLIINPGSTNFGRSKYKYTYVTLTYSDSEYQLSLKDAQTFSELKTFHYERKKN